MRVGSDDVPAYTAEQYAKRGFGLRKFDPGQCIDWIWGVRISDSEPVLVPLDLVFGRRQGPRLYRANSNGAACHSSLHHAVLRGVRNYRAGLAHDGMDEPLVAAGAGIFQRRE